MSLQIAAKLYVVSGGTGFSDYVPVFHDFIRYDRLKEVLIDVADYSHVNNGPGIVLVGHYGDYSVNDAKGRLGLGYRRKRGTTLENDDTCVRDAITRLLRVAKLLEQEPALAGLKFGTSLLEIRFADRLRFASTNEGEAFARRTIQNPLEQLFPRGFTVTKFNSEQELLAFEVASREEVCLDTLSLRIASLG